MKETKVSRDAFLRTTQYMLQEHIAVLAEVWGLNIFDVFLETDDGFKISNDGTFSYPVIKLRLKLSDADEESYTRGIMGGLFSYSDEIVLETIARILCERDDRPGFPCNNWSRCNKRDKEYHLAKARKQLSVTLEKYSRQKVITQDTAETLGETIMLTNTLAWEKREEDD